MDLWKILKYQISWPPFSGSWVVPFGCPHNKATHPKIYIYIYIKSLLMQCLLFPIKCNLYFTIHLVTVWSDADLYMAQQLSPMYKQYMQMLILWCTSDPIGSRKPPLKVSKEFLPIRQNGHGVMNHTDEILFFPSFLFYMVYKHGACRR